jgi:phospholipase/carboxylesterase
MTTANSDPHANQPLLTAGAALNRAKAVLILIHGRGALAQSILLLYDELQQDGLAAIAPQAAGNTWYPQSFLATIAANQPYLDSALRRIESIVEKLLTDGFAANRTALLGFSQGACLTSEFVARHPRQYGAVMALAGGLIGPPGTPREYSGSLDGTPVLIAAGDPDPHVPFERVRETKAVFERMGATVDMRRYPAKPHSINEEELGLCRALLQRMI